jgi:hypothetical protein
LPKTATRNASWKTRTSKLSADPRWETLPPSFV